MRFCAAVLHRNRSFRASTFICAKDAFVAAASQMRFALVDGDNILAFIATDAVDFSSAHGVDERPISPQRHRRTRVQVVSVLRSLRQPYR